MCKQVREMMGQGEGELGESCGSDLLSHSADEQVLHLRPFSSSLSLCDNHVYTRNREDGNKSWQPYGND